MIQKQTKGVTHRQTDEQTHKRKSRDTSDGWWWMKFPDVRVSALRFDAFITVRSRWLQGETTATPTSTHNSSPIIHPACTAYNHRRAVAQLCVNGDRLSQWRMAKFDPSQIRDPSPIDTNFETSDYVGETTPCAKFCANLGASRANEWNITEFFYSLIPFLMIRPQVIVIPVGGFLRAVAQTTRSHAKVCFLRVKNSK